MHVRGLTVIVVGVPARLRMRVDVCVFVCVCVCVCASVWMCAGALVRASAHSCGRAGPLTPGSLVKTRHIVGHVLLRAFVVVGALIVLRKVFGIVFPSLLSWVGARRGQI